MMYIKKCLGLVVAIGIVLGILPSDVAMAYSMSGTAKQVVEKMSIAIMEEDWECFCDCMCASEQLYYESYFADNSYTNGIKQIENVDFYNIYDVDYKVAEDELLVDIYPELSDAEEIYTYILEIDCDVKDENKYFYEGINYFLIAVVEENCEMKVVQFNRPSSQLLEQTISYELMKGNQLSHAREAALNVTKKADEGIIVNAQNEVLLEDFTIRNVVVEGGENAGISLAAEGTNNFPNLGKYWSYSYPSTINVRLNKTGNGSIVSVNFESYIKNTLPNEWYASWHSESLKAGAYCVKMVGWYRTIKPVSSAGGYDVTQGTQYYKPNSEKTTTNNAVNAIKNYGMADASNKLFFPEYAAGTQGSAGAMSGGQLKQWGSQYLASKKNYTCEEILNYYYMGSEYSNGSLVFFTY